MMTQRTQSINNSFKTLCVLCESSLCTLWLKYKSVQAYKPNYLKISLILLPLSARVAELVDALDSKSSDSNIVRVRFPPSVQKETLENHLIDKGFNFNTKQKSQCSS